MRVYPLGNQAVLLKGVNDDPDVMVELMKGSVTYPRQAVLHLSSRSRRRYRPFPNSGKDRFRYCRSVARTYIRAWRRAALRR